MSGEFFTTCTAENAIEYRGDSWAEPMYVLETGVINFSQGLQGQVRTLYKVHTPTTIEYIGMSLAAAKAYVINNPGTITYEPGSEGPPAKSGLTTIIKRRYERDGDSGYYKVVVEKETITDWSELDLSPT